MAQTNVVVQEKSAGVTPSGKSVTRQKTEVSSPKVEMTNMITRLIGYGAYIVDALLGFRFALKLLGANPGSGFVSFIYQTSSPFEWPFRSIFPVASTTGIEARGLLEPSTIVAFFVYLVVAVSLIELVKIVANMNSDE